MTFQTMEHVETKPPVGSQHGPVIISRVSQEELNRMYPPRKKTKAEIKQDKADHKAAKVHEKFREKNGWFFY